MTNNLIKDYVKCEYQEGMFDYEYFVKFAGSTERGTGLEIYGDCIGLGGWYAVMKEFVIPKDEKSGLLPIIIAEKREKNSSVLIDGALDVGAGEFFCIPNEEIVWEKD